jgi:hypothetical protein
LPLTGLLILKQKEACPWQVFSFWNKRNVLIRDRSCHSETKTRLIPDRIHISGTKNRPVPDMSSHTFLPDLMRTPIFQGVEYFGLDSLSVYSYICEW